jgi:type IV pilus assembly protein PilN
MIRINLLGGERQKKKAVVAFDINRYVTHCCVLVLMLAGALIGSWYWSLRQASEQVDAEIAGARQQLAQLQPIIRQVQQFEQRRAQLLQRVQIIEGLRDGQRTPVQLLDHVSRSLPEMLWLTTMTQRNNEVTIEGRSTTLIGVSDFIGNLGGGTVLRKPIELVSSQVEPVPGRGAGTAPDVIRFAVKAQITQTTPPPAPPAAARGRAAGARGRR